MIAAKQTVTRLGNIETCPQCGEKTGLDVLPNSSCQHSHTFIAIDSIEAARRIADNLHGSVLFSGAVQNMTTQTDQCMALALNALEQATYYFDLAAKARDGK